MTPASSRNASGPFNVSTSIRESLGTITMSCTVHSLSLGPLTAICPPLLAVAISRRVLIAFGSSGTALQVLMEYSLRSQPLTYMPPLLSCVRSVDTCDAGKTISLASVIAGCRSNFT
jgi:hypothetical protein